jgi:hypothetical protein
VDDHEWCANHKCTARKREFADPMASTDTPCRQERERHPSEIDEWHQHVTVERQDEDREQQLGVCRIEWGLLTEGGVVERERSALLNKAGSEREVIVQGIDTDDATA